MLRSNAIISSLSHIKSYSDIYYGVEDQLSEYRDKMVGENYDLSYFYPQVSLH